jgi:hypothetical protein
MRGVTSRGTSQSDLQLLDDGMTVWWHNARRTFSKSSGVLGCPMVYSTEYYWVVLCKNHRFHRKQNMFFGHSIPLGNRFRSTSPRVERKAQGAMRHLGRRILLRAETGSAGRNPASGLFCATPTICVTKCVAVPRTASLASLEENRRIVPFGAGWSTLRGRA